MSLLRRTGDCARGGRSMVESNGIEPFVGLRPDRSNGTNRPPHRHTSSRNCRSIGEAEETSALSLMTGLVSATLGDEPRLSVETKQLQSKSLVSCFSLRFVACSHQLEMQEILGLY